MFTLKYVLSDGFYDLCLLEQYHCTLEILTNYFLCTNFTLRKNTENKQFVPKQTVLLINDNRKVQVTDG